MAASMQVLPAMRVTSSDVRAGRDAERVAVSVVNVVSVRIQPSS
jgi:hypothetical protein